MTAASSVLHRGLFISFEGGEGSGKSTQARNLGAALASEGHAVVVTREPGGAAGAEAIRTLLVDGPPERWTPLAETLLFLAARAEHLDRTIRPALDQGVTVICDRFADSTLAYQGYARGLPCTFIAALNAEVVGATWPDVTIILDLPAETGLARAAARGGAQRFEHFDLAFHERLRQGYLTIAAAHPGRCVVIDARPGIAEVGRAIRDALVERIRAQRAS